MGSKFYAVTRGHAPGIYTDGAQASAQVKGFSNGYMKGFQDRQSAEAFFNSGGRVLNAQPRALPRALPRAQPNRQPTLEQIQRQEQRAEELRLLREALKYGPPDLDEFTRYPLSENPSASDVKTMADTDRQRDVKKKRKRSMWHDDDFMFDEDRPDSTEPYLVCAAAHGYTNVVAELLKRGVPVNIARKWVEVEEKWGYDKEWSWIADSALTVAIKGRHLETVKLLCGAGADKGHSCHHDDDNHYTPMELVAKMDMPEREAYTAAFNTVPVAAVAVRAAATTAAAAPAAPGAAPAAGGGGGVTTQPGYMRDQGIMRAELNRVEFMRNHLTTYGVPNAQKMPKSECKERIVAIQKEIMDDPNRIPFEYYGKLTAEGLKNFCRACDLPVGGNKGDLEARLIKFREEGNTVPENAVQMTQQVAPVRTPSGGGGATQAPRVRPPEGPPEAYTNHEQPPNGRRNMMMDPRYVSNECREALAALKPDAATLGELDKALGLLPKFSLSTIWHGSSKSTKVNYALKARAQILRLGVPPAPWPLESATVDQIKEFLRLCHLPLTGAKAALLDIVKEFVFYHGVMPRSWKDMPILPGFAPIKAGLENRAPSRLQSRSYSGRSYGDDFDDLPTQRRRW